MNDNYKPKETSLYTIREIGIELFGNQMNFLLWLKTPNHALGEIKPIALVKNLEGKELVMIILMRIKFGVYS